MHASAGVGGRVPGEYAAHEKAAQSAVCDWQVPVGPPGDNRAGNMTDCHRGGWARWRDTVVGESRRTWPIRIEAGQRVGRRTGRVQAGVQTTGIRTRWCGIRLPVLVIVATVLSVACSTLTPSACRATANPARLQTTGPTADVPAGGAVGTPGPTWPAGEHGRSGNAGPAQGPPTLQALATGYPLPVPLPTITPAPADYVPPPTVSRPSMATIMPVEPVPSVQADEDGVPSPRTWLYVGFGVSLLLLAGGLAALGRLGRGEGDPSEYLRVQDGGPLTRENRPPGQDQGTG